MICHPPIARLNPIAHSVALGPGLNVARWPGGGRIFEYLSGEDPALGAALAAAAVEGIQSNGIIANAKHFIFNNQEHDRGTTPLPFTGYSAAVDERAKWEIYMPPFAATVKAGVGSFMCSYNRIHDGKHQEVRTLSAATLRAAPATHDRRRHLVARRSTRASMRGPSWAI